MPRRPSLARPPARSAAKPPRSRIIVRERAANTRLFDFLIVKFLARADLLRQQHWEDDIDLAVIVGTVAVAVIEPRMRDEAFVRAGMKF